MPARMTRKRKPQSTRLQPPSSRGAHPTQDNNGAVLTGKVNNANGEVKKNGRIPSPDFGHTAELRRMDFAKESVGLIFPNWTPWAVFLITLIGRVIYVSQVKNWWILHPDEVFQSVEVAFSELHGYGFRAYEFLPPPGGFQLGSHARQQEANLGMHSLRSFIFPRVLITVMFFGDWLGIKPYLMTKVFHAVVASFLPLATYFFSSTIFHCHDIASMASVLVGFSVHLTVFGTHTLLNSFLAPIALFCLVPVMRNILAAEERPHYEEGKSIDNIVHKDSNGNAFVEIPRKTHNGQINGSLVGISDENTRRGGEWNSSMSLFLAGLMLGITCYIRIDLVLFIALVISPHCLKTRCNQLLVTLDLQVLLPIVLGFTSGMLLGGLEDKWSYGVWFISPYQWLRFNVGFDFATVLFGKQELDYYLTRILYHNYSLICVSVCFVIVLVFTAISSDFRREHRRSLAMLLKLFMTTFMLFIIYSLKGHKEMRFVHNAMVLLLIMYSSAIILPLKYMISRDWSRTHVKAGVLTCISLYLFNQWLVMPTPDNQSNKSWVYNSGWDSNHVNDCFDYISQQSDVTGVFVDRSIHTSAAFSVLRQDVPMLVLIHYELYEFGPKAYIHLAPVTSLARKDTVRVRTLSSISNYISIYNSHDYLLKLLLSRKSYNYLVLKKDKTFMDQGYEHIYTSGTMKVLRRTYDKSAEEYLAKVAASLPVGTNATILEYEASWLLTFGLLDLAEERLLTALQLGNPTPRLFQILVKIFLDQKKLDRARKAEQWCMDRHGVEMCRTPQPRIILHKDYDIALPT